MFFITYSDAASISDDIVVGVHLLLLIQYILQGNAVQVFVNDTIKTLPYREGGTAGTAAAFNRIMLQTSHRSQTAFRQAQYFTDGVFIRRLGQTVAALKTPGGTKNIGFI